MGVFEIRTSETIESQNIIINILKNNGEESLTFDNIDGHSFEFDHNIKYNNILGKWSKMCISYNFETNEAQAAFNGKVSPNNPKKDPQTLPNYKNTWDANIITEASTGSELILIVGRYAFDKNPIIGSMANINAWDRTLSVAELVEKTRCDGVDIEPGNIVNKDSSWNLTGSLIKKVSITVNETKCSRQKSVVNAFLPIPELTREDAEDLCKKFGQDVAIAGDFETKEDFDMYYESLQANQRYMDQCGFYDNGRIKTWLPYHHNIDRSKLIHVATGKPLMLENENKFYVDWYAGPQSNKFNDQCVASFFGLVPKYQNIEEDSCNSKKCTACELRNSFEKTSSMNLNGLCKYSFFDKIFQVQYNSEDIIYYVGNEKTLIKYNFDEKLWKMSDASNPYVSAVSDAPFRSLAIGNYLWNITNDTECGKEFYSKFLSLTSCSEHQFTCNNGLCISIDQRYNTISENIYIFSHLGVMVYLTARTLQMSLGAWLSTLAQVTASFCHLQ